MEHKHLHLQGAWSWQPLKLHVGTLVSLISLVHIKTRLSKERGLQLLFSAAALSFAVNVS